MTDSSQWMSVGEAVRVTRSGRTTITRWVDAGYVRRMKIRGRVVLRRSDVTETERSVFDGEAPMIRT